METVQYGRYGTCVRLANGQVDLLVTRDIGPRIIRFGFIEQPNLFVELPPAPSGAWDLYGGHRLWHAPESLERTYHRDNQPVRVVEEGSRTSFHQPVEPDTGIQKRIDIDLHAVDAAVRVSHSLTNRGRWPVKLSVWALSAMAGGTAIVPQAPFAPHTESLLPARGMTLWAYTNMADPRWTWGRQFVLLRQDPAGPGPQKVGIHDEAGWIGWQRDDTLFIKRFDYHADREYPDGGSTVEVFTNPDFIEVETLSPYVLLQPGATATHIERWSLASNFPLVSEPDLASALAGHLRTD